jgi:hypothetical protein
MVDIQTISIVIASAGVLIGVLFTYEQVRDVVRSRQTELVMTLYRDFGSKDFQEAWQKIMSSEYKDYPDFVEKYGLDGLWQVVMLFEGIGTLLDMKLVNVPLLQHLVSGSTVSTWEKMKPVIEGHRQKTNQPQFCEWFEYLYNEMKKREQSGVKNG